MKPDRWKQINQLYHDTLEREPGQRMGFLLKACGDDSDLLREVESLLVYPEESRDLMAAPVLQAEAHCAVKPKMENRTELLIGKQLGSYEIVALLGRGGMGEVYLARDSRLGRKVALKLLPAEFTKDEERVRRFKREARVASALNHPNILTIYEIGQAEGTTFIATEFIEGQTFRQQLAHGPTKLSELLDVALQVASALVVAHEAGIVHRDVKPENVMVRPDGLVKVLDFGLAKLNEPSATSIDSQVSTRATVSTEPGVVMGTVQYMSPEQVLGEEVDHRTDIFSLGVLLYETATGTQPFQGNSPGGIFDAILHVVPASPRHSNPGLPLELERIILKALDKERELRYQTVSDLRADLRRLKREMESEQPTTAAAAASQRPTRRRGGPSLAILPFVNVGADPNLDYLSDGIAENLTNSLSRLAMLRVVPRTRAFRYRGNNVDPVRAGLELDVKAILTGRVALRGDNLNIQIELIDIAQDSQLWGEQYSRSLSEILAVQDDIVRAVSEKLRLNPSPEEQRRMIRRYTEDIEAYQLYLKGRYYWDKRTVGMLRKAAEQFRQALEKDPTYALAYAGLAEAYAVYAVYNVTSPDQAAPLAKAAVREALRIDDTIAEAHTALAFVRMTYDFDLAGAEQEFRRAIELNPDHPTAHFWYGLYHIARRQHDPAIAEFRRAQEAAPLSLNVNSYFGWGLLFARRPDQAIEQLHRTLDIDPNFPNAHLFLGMSYEQQGRYGEALEEIQKARDLSGGNLLMIGALGHAFGSAGLRVDAEAVLAEMTELRKERYVAALDFAYVHSGLRDKENTFHWLEQAYKERSAWLLWIDADSRLDWLRSEPQFIDLLRHLKLTS